MTIEITNPETEALIQQYLQSGQFHDVEDLLANALGALKVPVVQPAVKDRSLVELFDPIRGLFADGELDVGRKASAVRSPDTQEKADPKQRPVWELLLENMEDVPSAEFAKLPTDGASQHDHYLYGHPKRAQ